MSYLTGGFLVGEVRNYAGSAAPAGWLFCYGQTVSKNDYPELFDIIGNTYGGVSPNFVVPDLRGRTIAGRDDMGGPAANRLTSAGFGATAALGATGTAVETTTLTAAQSGEKGHSHDISHTHSTTGVSANHSHLMFNNVNSLTALSTNTQTTSSQYKFGTAGANEMYLMGSAGAATADIGKTGSESADHSHTTNSQSVSSVNVSGSSAASSHTNVQPTIILNHIIKF